jgi:glycosyltransferase involved in cell wall biosynthesis
MNEISRIFAEPVTERVADGRTVAFVALGDARDPHWSSGSPYGMRKGFIDIGCNVVDVLSVRSRREALFFPLRVGYRFAGRYYSADRAPLCLSGMAREIGRRIQDVEPDLIFAAHSIPLSRVRSSVPCVLSHDQTFIERLAYSPYERRPLAKRYIAEAIAQEREAFAGATLCVYPSERSIRSLQSDYDVPDHKLAMIPWGGNLPADPDSEAVEAMILGRPNDAIHLLFLGVDWERKGGDLVLATAALLAARGRQVKLTLIGCTPAGELPDYVRIIPFLDKRDPDGLNQLLAIFAETHFLFVPSRAEAYGHVFCEAAAMGVPSLACDVGGIPTIIADGENGHCLPTTASAAEFARVIERALEAPETYRGMARAARRAYEERLNWSAFARAVLARVDALST